MSIVWTGKDTIRGVMTGRIEPSGQQFSFRYEGENKGIVISAYSIPPETIREIATSSATMQG